MQLLCVQWDGLVQTLATVSTSHGRMVHRSISSHDTCSLSCAIWTTSRSTCTWVPQPTSVTSLPVDIRTPQPLTYHQDTTRICATEARLVYHTGRTTTETYLPQFCRPSSKCTQGRHQVQQTGVDNTGRGLWRGLPSPVGGEVAPSPEKNDVWVGSDAPVCFRWVTIKRLLAVSAQCVILWSVPICRANLQP